MRPLSNEDLMDGEKVIAQYEMSWFSHIQILGLSIVLVIIGVFLAFAQFGVYGLFLMLFMSSILILMSVIEHKSVAYFITSERVIVRRGIFSKHINGIPYCKIQNLQLKKSAVQNLLDIGTIWVDVAGRPEVEMCLTYLKDPEAAQRLILEQMGSGKGKKEDSP